MTEQCYEGDVGTQMVYGVQEDAVTLAIQAATDLILYFRKPSGELLTKTAQFLTDGSDGKIYYTTIAGDLDEHGVWTIQSKISLSGGTHYGDTKMFSVLPHL